MFSRRRKKECQNCGLGLEEVYNFCPRCGQENNDRNVSAGTLVREMFENYFSLDSRFGRSLKPFFFKPGYLSKEFVEGKRMSYANPVRLYLLLSVLFFFILSISNSMNEGKVSREDTIVRVEESDYDVSIESNDETGWFNRVADHIDWKTVDSLRFNSYYSDRQLVDSMNIHDLNFVERKLAYQMVRLYRADAVEFQQYLLNNLPVMMIFVIPILALWLKWFYRRNRPLYIHHLVHSLHIHCFLYSMMSLGFIGVIISPSLQIDIALLIISLAIVIIYVIASIKNFYNYSFIGTILRVVPMLLGFTLSLCIVLFIEVALSMILF